MAVQLKTKRQPNTYILKTRFKGHQTWRISMTNRRIERIRKAIAHLEHNGLEKYEILIMDGKTGKINPYTDTKV